MKLRQFSGQGIEKTNDAVKHIYHSKTNKHDSCVDTLKVRKQIETAVEENYTRQKRTYNKQNEDYWENSIFQNKRDKQDRIRNEMNDKNNVQEDINLFLPSVSTINESNKQTRPLKDLHVSEIKEMLKNLEITTSVRKREKLVNMLENAMKSSGSSN